MTGDDPRPVSPLVVLASASPRRRELLAQLGVDFTIRPVDVSEVVLPGETPQETALRLALSKLERAMKECDHSSGPDHLVIAADTVVEVDGETLGKPQDANDATAMLRRLRDREHLMKDR